MLLIGGFFYFSEGFTFKSEHPFLIVLGGFVLFFFFSFLLIQYQNEYYIFSKVKALYDAFYSDGVPLSKELMKRDAQSLTKSIQEFAKESKLEIELLKGKENYRKEFIGNLAHELKTPLFTVESYILTLADGAAEDEVLREKYLQKAAQGVDRLNHIVTDLDLITKFEAGITSIEKFLDNSNVSLKPTSLTLGEIFFKNLTTLCCDITSFDKHSLMLPTNFSFLFFSAIGS